jgi:gamma-glutamylcyclotransferase (GGCT)/AIG2-like uncharacterized protein YtfP
MTSVTINPTTASDKYTSMLLGYRLIFVYGTLKKGFHNHHFIETQDHAFIAEATSVDKLVLYNYWGLPYVRKPLEGEEGNYIKGELYGIKDLSMIDHLEGAPTHYHQKRLFFAFHDDEYDEEVQYPAIIYLESNVMSNEVEELTEWTIGKEE